MTATKRTPVLVGRGCRLEEGVIIEGPTVVGDGCTVDKDCHIVRGVILPRSMVPAGSVVVGGALGQRFTPHDCGR